MIGTPAIYLASRSPRRRRLLQQLGVPFELLLMREAAGRSSRRRRSGRATASRRAITSSVIARTKASAGWERAPDASCRSGRAGRRHRQWCSTTRSSASPADAEDAAAMLARLAGRKHEVLTGGGAALRDDGAFALSVSQVTFAHPTRAEIDAYVATGEPLDKAGAYAIQGRAAAFIERIDGSYSGIDGPAAVRDRAPAQDPRPSAYHSVPARAGWAFAAGIHRCPGFPTGRKRHRHAERNPDQCHAAGNARRGDRSRAPCRNCTSSARSERGLVGNVYLGKVARVLPGMQSAFIDIGLERAAFLHVADIWDDRQNGQRRSSRRRTADRENPVRGPDAAGAGDQGPDRHQGRAAVHAGQHRRPHAGVPAAGLAHRHLAAHRGRGRARSAARAAAAAAARRRERRLHHPHHGRRRHRAPSCRPTSHTCASCGSDPARAQRSRRPRQRCCTRI